MKLAEGIVPGSTKAEVNRFVDLLLSVETAERQREFTGALKWMNEVARNLLGLGTAELDEGDVNSLPRQVTSLVAERVQFKVVKEWVVGAFYSSEMGMRELGWDGTVAFAEYPVCGSGKSAEQKN